MKLLRAGGEFARGPAYTRCPWCCYLPACTRAAGRLFLLQRTYSANAGRPYFLSLFSLFCSRRAPWRRRVGCSMMTTLGMVLAMAVCCWHVTFTRIAARRARLAPGGFYVHLHTCGFARTARARAYTAPHALHACMVGKTLLLYLALFLYALSRRGTFSIHLLLKC